MQIFIKTLTGKQIPLTVSDEETVESLKVKIQENEGIVPEVQRLVILGKKL